MNTQAGLTIQQNRSQRQRNCLHFSIHNAEGAYYTRPHTQYNLPPLRNLKYSALMKYFCIASKSIFTISIESISQQLMKKILLICLLVTWQATTYSYSIGLKSRDNSNANIQRVEETTKISLPLVSFIFDPRDTNAYQTVADIPYTLGKNRIYHITVSP